MRLGSCCRWGHFDRWKSFERRRTRPRRAANDALLPAARKRPSASKVVAVLARPEHPQDQHVAGGVVAAGIRDNAIQRPVTTLAG